MCIRDSSWALDYSHSKLLYHQSDFNAYQYSYNVLKEYQMCIRDRCRITLNGEERWVRNVIIRGEIEDSEYAMIFLRDIRCV